MKKQGIIFLIPVIFLINMNSLQPQELELNSAVSLYQASLRADEASASGDLDTAIKIYKNIEKKISQFPEAKKFIQSYYYQIPQVQILEYLKNLKNRKPEVVHKILVLYIKKTSVNQSVSNKEPNKNSGIAANEFMPEQIKSAEIAQDNFRHYIRYATDGMFDVEFERHVLDASVLEVDSGVHYDYDGKPYYAGELILDGISPYPGNFLYNKYNSFDTVFIYWDDKNISSRPTGRLLEIPLNPFQIYGPKRGVVKMMPGYKHGGTLFHEFFHILEVLYGIHPGHGFLPGVRKNFSAWKGEGQFSYFLWHFQNSILSAGLAKTNLKKQFPLKLDLNRIHDIEDKTDDISFQNRLQAFYLLKDARKTKEKRKYKNIINEALELHPMQPEILYLSARLNYDQKKYSEAMTQLEKALFVKPGDSLLLLWKAKVLQQTGKSGEALMFYNQAVNADPDNAVMYYYRAFYFYVNRHQEKAVEDYQKCISLDPGYKKTIADFLTPVLKSSSSESRENAKKILEGLK